MRATSILLILSDQCLVIPFMVHSSKSIPKRLGFFFENDHSIQYSVNTNKRNKR